MGFKYLLAELGSRSAPLCVVRVKGKFSSPAEVSSILSSIISYVWDVLSLGTKSHVLSDASLRQ